MTTKHRRPIVWRDDYLVNDGINPWVAAVRHPSGNGYVGHNFATHAEALAYAYRMARTVTVELPADPNKHAPYMGYEASSDAPLYHQFGALDWEPSNKISLERSQIESFALALLAHHYRNETP